MTPNIKVFFEGYTYPSGLIDDCIGKENPGREFLSSRKGVNAVGYFYVPPPEKQGSDRRPGTDVFLLPKVFCVSESSKGSPSDVHSEETTDVSSSSQESEDDDIDEKPEASSKGKAFGVHIEELVHWEGLDGEGNPLREDESGKSKAKKQWGDLADFVEECPIWIVRALDKYAREKVKKDAPTPELVIYGDEQGRTLPSLVNEILDLYKKNRDYYIFVKVKSSSGLNRPDWPRTVRRSQAWLSEKSGKRKPVYLDLQSHIKRIDYDEELMVLFLSTVAYLKRRGWTRVELDVPYNLLFEGEYERLLEGAGEDDNLGVRRLRRMRNNYFNDRMLEIWRLMMAWFRRVSAVRNGNPDMLIATSFQVVFEAMVDELFGGEKELPPDLKKQKDGKRIDHIFAHDALFRSGSKIKDGKVEKVWYIGDSKYYRLTGKDPRVKDFGEKSYFKQFTYAKNVIQEMVNKINSRKGDKEDCEVVPANYRDKETEGYAVTPNFFVSAIVKEGYTLKESKFEPVTPSNQAKMESCHFPDRLFDRDTLLLQQYNINFLYVLASYVGAPGVQPVSVFRDTAYDLIRQKTLEMLRERYHFWCIPAQKDNDALKWKLRGKIFPCPDVVGGGQDREFWLLAKKKNEKDEKEPDDFAELRPVYLKDICSVFSNEAWRNAKIPQAFE